MAPKTKTPPPRIQIQDVWPMLDCGRYPPKRSVGDTVEVWATIFKDGQQELPRLAELGFDVLYFPPIHPIGVTNRKGRNNALQAKKGDPGSPWAIGSEDGGHDAVNPELGTIRDFDRLVSRARELG